MSDDVSALPESGMVSSWAEVAEWCRTCNHTGAGRGIEQLNAELRLDEWTTVSWRAWSGDSPNWVVRDALGRRQAWLRVDRTGLSVELMLFTAERMATVVDQRHWGILRTESRPWPRMHVYDELTAQALAPALLLWREGGDVAAPVAVPALDATLAPTALADAGAAPIAAPAPRAARAPRACALTGCTVEPLLEVAHVASGAGDTPVVLRCDLHRLFDHDLLRLVASDEGIAVTLDPSLQGSDYARFHGAVLAPAPVA
jgi:hypothetical protein